jgi:DNA-nicking Smr family endonuclease
MDHRDDDDARAFREAVRGARPLRHPPRVNHRAPPAPRARFRRADEAAVLAESLTLSAAELEVESGDELSFRRPGVQDAVMRKLRRGHYRVEAELDLHGLIIEQAREALRTFLARAVARHLRCVRIVHGKGLGSGPRGPVLKKAVNLILRKTAPVVAFCSARQIDGGTGAIYVLISDGLGPSPPSSAGPAAARASRR